MAARAYTEDDERCFRLSALIVNVGTGAARKLLDTDVQRNHGSLSSALYTGGTQQRMQRYLKPPQHSRIPKLLSQHQYDTLYPTPPQVPTSNDFDLTLLMFLFRNLLYYNPPPKTKNWNVEPHITDLSLSAHLLRLKKVRNEVYAHINSTQLTETDFNTHWTYMEKALLGLDPSLTSAIDGYKDEDLSPSQYQKYEEYKTQIRQLMESDLSDLQCMLHTLQNLVKENDASLQTELSDIQKSLGQITDDDPTPVLALLKKLPTDISQVIIQTLGKPLTEIITEASKAMQTHVTKEGESVKTHVTKEVAGITEASKAMQTHVTKEGESVKTHVTKEGDYVRALVTKEVAGIIEAMNALNVKCPDDDRGEKRKHQPPEDGESSDSEEPSERSGAEYSGKGKKRRVESGGGQRPLVRSISQHEREEQLQQHITEKYLHDVSSSLKSYYAKRYKKIPFIPWDDTSHILIDDIYVPLKLEENKDNQWKQVPGERLRNIEELISKHGQKDGREEPVKLIIQGKPGAGKSTTCYKLVYDWTKGDSVLAVRYELVILLKARDFSQDQDLFQAITDSIPDYNEEHCDKLKQILQKNKLLIILDGYDELGEKIKQKDLNKLLDNRLYHKCDLIVTTRHWCTDHLKKYTSFDQIFTICPFDNDDTESYVSKFFIYIKNENKDAVQNFMWEVMKNDLDNLVKEPLTCLFLCCVWEINDGKKLPEIRAQIYDQVLSKVMKETYNKKQKIGDNLDEDKFNTLLEFLSKLAFEKLAEAHSILQFERKHLEDIYKIDVELACAIGILVKADPPAAGKKTLNRCDYYTFPHLTFQEFLAARYLYYSEVDLDQACGAMITNLYMKSYGNMYNFFFGHLAIESDKDITEDKLDRVNQMAYLTIKGERKSYGYSAIQQLEASGCNDRFPWAELSNKVLEYFAKHRTSTVHEPCIDKLRFAVIQGDFPHWPLHESVREYFKSSASQCQARLCFSSVCQKLAQSNTLKELRLEYIECDCDSKGSSLGNLLAVNKDLEKVEIYGCPLNANDVMVMAPHFSNLNALIKLELSFMSLAGSVGHIIDNLCETIKCIIMRYCDISSEDAKRMAPKLSRLTLLTEFEICNIPLGHSAVDITENLSPSIQELHMVSCDISRQHAEMMAPKLSTLTHLTEFHISYNPLGHSAVGFIENLSPSIQKLHMRECGISSQHAEMMAPGLKRLTLLTEFQINGNPLGHSAIDIIENLSTSIQQLNMERCGLSVEDVKSLAPHLQRLTALERLWLEGNVPDKGERASCKELIKRYNSRVYVSFGL